VVGQSMHLPPHILHQTTHPPHTPHRMHHTPQQMRHRSLSVTLGPKPTAFNTPLNPEATEFVPRTPKPTKPKVTTAKTVPTRSPSQTTPTQAEPHKHATIHSSPTHTKPVDPHVALFHVDLHHNQNGPPSYSHLMSPTRLISCEPELMARADSVSRHARSQVMPSTIGEPITPSHVPTESHRPLVEIRGSNSGSLQYRHTCHNHNHNHSHNHNRSQTNPRSNHTTRYYHTHHTNPS